MNSPLGRLLRWFLCVTIAPAVGMLVWWGFYELVIPLWPFVTRMTRGVGFLFEALGVLNNVCFYVVYGLVTALLAAWLAPTLKRWAAIGVPILPFIVALLQTGSPEPTWIRDWVLFVGISVGIALAFTAMQRVKPDWLVTPAA